MYCTAVVDFISKAECHPCDWLHLSVHLKTEK